MRVDFLAAIRCAAADEDAERRGVGGSGEDETKARRVSSRFMEGRGGWAGAWRTNRPADNREQDTFQSRGDMLKKHEPLFAKHPCK